VFNFDEIPTVVGGPYEYGVPGAVHAVFKEKPAGVPAPAGGGGAPPPTEP
jgi:cytochrome c oxidase subunit 1